MAKVTFAIVSFIGIVHFDLFAVSGAGNEFPDTVTICFECREDVAPTTTQTQDPGVITIITRRLRAH